MNQLLDPPLVLEMRDAGVPMCGTDRLIEQVLNARVLRQAREPLPLLLLALDPRLLGVLHGNGAPHTVQRLSQRRFVIEIGLHDLRTLLS